MAKSCPVNFLNIDENQVRFQALLVMLSTIGFIFTGWAAFGVLLVYDFIARLFVSPKFSIFAQITLLLIKIFNVPSKPVDSAPKLFASRIGFGFSLAILAASLFGFDDAAIIFAIVLGLCAGMDAILNYCIGCKCYAILHHFKIV
ncbi:DUF4395 domain-containing protein [Sulfurimonas sp.]|uniref:DUF4395 domain-containing protein n=1 Tax=Sulfurimonas sp. TaxID=2022749 RepID=UPI00260DC4EE|nr:DUF4395 domain-containing protein [Sulfurimonas sp.]MCW8896360.1 DUF4395 domain-containing protein [Sulfurimonas sp.]MCW9068321.1 DUF4395 domain-containing protein [Sulfurimonas sp.]